VSLARSGTSDPPRAEAETAGLGLVGVVRFLWGFARPQPWALAALGVLMVLNRVAGLVTPASTKFLVDSVIAGGRHALLLPLAAGVFLASLFQSLTTYALTEAMSRSAQRLITRLRLQVHAHVNRLSMSYFDAHHTGRVASLIMHDVEAIQSLLGSGLLRFASGVLLGVFAAAAMLYISPLLATGSLLGLAVLGGLIGQAFTVHRPISRESRKLASEVLARLFESLGGIRIVKAYRAEEREEASFAKGNWQLHAIALRANRGRSLLRLAGTAGFGALSAVMLYCGAREILAGRLSVGDLFMFTVLLGYMLAPMSDVLEVAAQFSDALAGIERIDRALLEEREDQVSRRVKRLTEIRGEVEFEAVRFAYDPERTVLHDVSFRAAPGSLTALVGPSGAGKSTVVALIAGFYSPQGGRVLVDGIDLSMVHLASYRGCLGMVLQETFLFDGTVWENIIFARPEADRARVLSACRAAYVSDFVEEWPNGYETHVGERGVRLSGGQRQRVAIARAMLADPRIVILDEATSSLDATSERHVQQGLARLLQGRTTFVIAHRLSTIRRADQILVMEDGRVVESGSHSALHAQRGLYYAMYMQQVGDDGQAQRGSDVGASDAR
jgi:ABC-type multidrug transport system fused ATPase/permease subunit